MMFTFGITWVDPRRPNRFMLAGYNKIFDLLNPGTLVF